MPKNDGPYIGCKIDVLHEFTLELGVNVKIFMKKMQKC